MDFLPIFTDLRQRACLVVGGGEVAARKTALLLSAGADVILVSPEICPTVAQSVAEGKIRHLEREFENTDIGKVHLVFAATNNAKVNEQVSILAQASRIPVNVADNPKLCSFIMPSIIDRSPVVAAVSTGGASPVLARLIRGRLETLIPAAYGRLATLVEGFRVSVKQRFSGVTARRAFWERVLQGPVAEMVFAGRDDEARNMLEQMVKSADDHAADNVGEVYLVGGGPGDPDLLTFRALRLMQQADVVVYDRLVAKEILEMTRRDAERIYVGKARDQHTVAQEDINHLLARLAKEGKRVLRLKGGDPFIFGRGGEEIETLVDEQVPFQVVPGITAASGCASYAGIPLTHRDYSQACIFVTGHLKDGTVDLNWPALAHPNQTLVFYMGLMGLAIICKELIAHGMPAETPIALVQKGTTNEQKIFIGKLSTMPASIANQSIKPPTLIIVGRVIELHDKLNWFEPPAN